MFLYSYIEIIRVDQVQRLHVYPVLYPYLYDIPTLSLGILIARGCFLLNLRYVKIVVT